MSRRILGLDFGEKHLGLALSDELRKIAARLVIVPNDGAALTRIMDIAQQYQVKEVVVGRPRTIAGDLGSQAKEAVVYGGQLKDLGFTVYYEDESATTDLAYRKLKSEGTSPKKWPGLVDMVAAEIILQGWLDEKKS